MKKITVLFFLLLSVCFAYAQEVTIGTGTITQEYPLSSYYGHQRSAALYTATEINQTGFINKLAWDIGKMGERRPVKIYLKSVDENSLVAANWETLTTGATLVYNGTFTADNDIYGFHTLNLDRSFNYVGGTKNLVVLVETNAGGAGLDEAEGLKIKASESTNRHLTARVDNTNATGNLSFVSSRPNIKMIFGSEIRCYGIHAFIDTVRATSIRIAITPQATTNSFSYEVRTQGNPGSGATGLATSGTVTNLNTPFFNIRGLSELTTYTLYVRANCANDQFSLYSEPLTFRTIENVAGYLVEDDFEGDLNFIFVNDTNNKWHVGNAVHNGGTKSLYISKDGGQTNTYNNAGVQVSHAYKEIAIPQHAEDLQISFDWRCLGQGDVKDYFRVWLVSSAYTPTARTQITANATRIQVGKTQYYQDATFSHEQTFLPVAAFAGQTVRLVFEWKQDSSLGEDPPAAIDNLKVKAYYCKKVDVNSIQVSNITATEGTVTWASSNAASYEVFLTESPNILQNSTNRIISTDFRELSPATTTNTTYTFTNLKPGTQYLVWVRAKCGPNEWSVFSGPKILATDMKLVDLPYREDFEGVTNFEFKKNDVKNKWFIGSAVNNGGSKALYISEDYGATNTYNVVGSQVSHVYKDFKVPAGTQEINVRFDWRCVGQLGGSDYLRVWAVPQNFVPTTGIQINAPNPQLNRIQVGKFYYQQQQEFKFESSVFDATAFAGGNVRLVFEWRQDASGGTQPPAAIDNLVVEAKTCPAPKNFRVVETSGTSVTLNWDRIPRQNKFEIYHSTTNAYPGDEVTESIVTTQRPYKLNGLEPKTDYVIWIRTICSETSKSAWVPLLVNTGQLPADFPYVEDFEGVDNWDFNKSTTHTNEWVVGSAVNNGGSKSLYITQDKGVTNSYNVAGQLITHAYRDIAVPVGTAEVDMSFDWRCMGDGTTSKRDYFRVWLVPRTYNPVVGTLITTEVNRMQVGGMLNQQGNFVTFNVEDIDISRFEGKTMRLVFEWIQDASNGTQPPAAIDNIKIGKGSCPGVRNLQSEPIAGSNPKSASLTWDVYGVEAQWEVFIIELDDPTVPGVATQGIIVNEPRYVFRDPDPTNTTDRFYKFFVRPLCDAVNERKWSKQGVISFIPPPGCARVEAGIEFTELEGLQQNEKGEYVICDKGTFNFKLGASYYDILKTSTYKVEPIEYRPPFPFRGGNSVSLTRDDYWSGIIDLGFDFCFFGNTYNKVLIGTNGMITFSIKDSVPGGRYRPNTGSEFRFGPEHQIPIDRGAYPPYVNTIHGVMQDMYPTLSPADYSVNYEIVGKAPCRTLVFNLYHMGMFSCGYDRNDIEGSTTTSQIVLYEGTNIIEVYVKNRKACVSFNDGSGLIGIQNADGTAAYTPPGRNSGAWNAQNEAWRFTPNGLSTAEFTWEKDGEYFSSAAEINVDVTETVKYTAKATYEICEEETILTKEFIFIKEDFSIGNIKDLVDCARRPGEFNLFDLRDAYNDIYGDLDRERYTLKLFETIDDRDKDRNPLLDIVKFKGTSKPIYVKLTNKFTGCIELKTFKLNVAPHLTVTTLKDQSVCGSYLLPKLEKGEAYYTKPYGKGKKYEGGETFSEVGIHDIYIYKEEKVEGAAEDEAGCYGQSQFVLEVTKQVVADQIANMVLTCEIYKLPTLSEDNKYYTLPNGEGQELLPGMPIIEPTTIYILARNKGEKGAVCIDQSSFTIDFDECPIPKGISPNGDGVNDSFDLTGYGVSKIQIFNRSGIEVYSQGRYNKEWMGQDKSGNKLPAGTYYYIIISNGKQRTGWVQLN
ncbi:T9SS type B sorting domain-containing protein [Myroides fluvii]|uniref:T9SS type B sorting domain-containing protein n=1 Tax=Myroides fluvii TaxID=2572594 RepID=UPI00131E5BC7|nr:gliding motility-associated C-terminal domain-containing protein [Myroides fluvii]